ncbi:MAG TPA: BON domain-containing protein [Candidatus Limnocylindrales bacterium]|nr:BON domain-containing protein [Candidatus Limnocylindrales bacterium]
MSGSRQPSHPPKLDAADIAMLEEIQTLQGEELPMDQDAVLEPDEIEGRRRLTRTELDGGATEPDLELLGGQTAALDGLALDDLRTGETDDPKVAAEEGLSYVPPIDPPVRSDAEEPGGLEVAAGMAVSAESDPYDTDHRSELLSIEGDLTARIREALEADAATSGLADRLIVGTRGSTAVVRGVVDGLEDTDTIVAVIGRVEGIEDVIDETDVAGG